ncbi:hypothetical protein KC19_9G138800 [Ceratodon purpureus]|uniref:Peptide deformylase n=1 Tax=Ceratodon purpureus TaxID=3225 RepID=A0A8T0GZK8_CERPU|nr:hypothetical protein KC19_9G138800 [Ceratodon purpureus]
MVGGTCRCTVATATCTSPATASSLADVRSATTQTMRLEARSHSGERQVGASWCRPVVAAASSCRLGGSASGRRERSIWNSSATTQPHPAGHYCAGVSSEKLVCQSGACFVGRIGRGKGIGTGTGRGGEGSSVGVVTTRFGGGRLLRGGDAMDCAMPHLMDTAPFRGVCQAPSRMREARDFSVPMAFFGFGKSKLPDVVQAGDPVLHEPAEEVKSEDIGSARIEKTINDMVDVMRAGPGVGLAAPQIGVPLQIIVLEDTKELMSYTSPEECEAQQRTPFDLMVIINPRLERKESGGTAFFFEGCLSVGGHRALVERNLEVEVTGLGRDGQPIRFTATGWKARILQHEYDHLQGLLYVDQMVKRTFRTTENLRLPLPSGCPKPGVCK